MRKDITLLFASFCFVQFGGWYDCSQALIVNTLWTAYHICVNRKLQKKCCVFSQLNNSFVWGLVSFFFFTSFLNFLARFSINLVMFILLVWIVFNVSLRNQTSGWHIFWCRRGRCNEGWKETWKCWEAHCSKSFS